MTFLDQNLQNEQLRPLAKKLAKEIGRNEDDARGYETILANLANGQELEYSICEGRYPVTRYAPFYRRDILAKLKALTDYHLIRSVKDRTVVATAPLQDQLSKITSANVLREPIILRRGKTDDPDDWSRDIEYADTDETELMRAELHQYNECMSRQQVTDTNGVCYSTTLRRIFNNSSFDCGGRFYGGKSSYQALAGHDGTERTHRRELLINGNPTIELDYSAFHYTLLLLREGLPIPEDPYMIAGFERDTVKRVFNIAINARCDSSAIGAIVEKTELSEEEAERYLSVVKAHMGELSRYLCSNEGIRLQRIDSNIAANIMRDCTMLGVPVLVIHDSFRVEQSRKAWLNGLMIKYFQKELLTDYVPRIK